MHPRRFAVASIGAGIALALALVVAPVVAADRTVTIQGFAFSPKTVSVNVGDTVTWRNNDDTAHTATDSGKFNTGDIGPGAAKSVTFKAAGTYSYICAIHPTMTGTVVVRAAGGGGTTPNTDMAPTDIGRGGDWIATVLALLGVVMVVGTIVVDRLLRRRGAALD
jgi:plastocyanin